MKLKFRTRFEISPLPPFDFRLTVRKPAGWSLFTSAEVYEDETLWTGIRSGARPVGLKIKSQGTLEKPRVLVGVYSGRRGLRGGVRTASRDPVSLPGG